MSWRRVINISSAWQDVDYGKRSKSCRLESAPATFASIRSLILNYWCGWQFCHWLQWFRDHTRLWKWWSRESRTKISLERIEAVGFPQRLVPAVLVSVLRVPVALCSAFPFSESSCLQLFPAVLVLGSGAEREPNLPFLWGVVAGSGRNGAAQLYTVRLESLSEGEPVCVWSHRVPLTVCSDGCSREPLGVHCSCVMPRSPFRENQGEPSVFSKHSVGRSSWIPQTPCEGQRAGHCLQVEIPDLSEVPPCPRAAPLCSSQWPPTRYLSLVSVCEQYLSIPKAAWGSLGAILLAITIIL